PRPRAYRSAALLQTVAKADCRGADQGSVGAEAGRQDARARGERQPSPFVDLYLRGVEEQVAVAERDRPGHHRQAEVEQVRDRRDRPTDEHSRADLDIVRRVLRGPSGEGADRRARRLGLYATDRAAAARAP